MALKKVTYLLLVFSSFILQSQNSNYLKTLIDSIEKSEISTNEKIEKLTNLISSSNNFSEEKGHLYHSLGIQHYNNGDYLLAVDLFKKSIEQRKRLSNLDTLKINNLLSNIAALQSWLDERKDIKTFKKIISFNHPDKYTLNAYSELILFHLDNKDYLKAILLLDSKTELLRSYKAEDYNIWMFKLHSEYIHVYSSMEDSENFIKEITYHGEENLTLTQYAGEKDLAAFYNNYGSFHEEIGYLKKAEKLYTNALKHYKNENDSLNIGKVYNNLGKVFSELKNHRSASLYYNKALQITKNNEVQAAVYDNQGYYLQTKSDLERIPFYQKAIAVLTENTINNNPKELLPSIDQLSLAPNIHDVIDYLNDMAISWV